MHAYLLHVRSFGGHGDRDHLKAERAADGEMTVVSGRGAEELDASLTAPGLVASAYAEEHAADDGVEHQIQRGVARYDDALGLDAQQIGEELFGLRKSVQDAVVAAVQTALGEAVVGVGDNAQHAGGKIQLIGTGLSAGEIQLEGTGAVGVHLCLCLGTEGGQFFF